MKQRTYEFSIRSSSKGLCPVTHEIESKVKTEALTTGLLAEEIYAEEGV
ncbi:MAG: hypothetical protein VYC17_05125 [Nitrospinota bacterium]|nr:hypothetical protein [Nitrospinota bacterium]